jgi:hypothetical protein
MKSIDEKIDSMTLGELKTLHNKLPRLVEELDAFASDYADFSNQSKSAAKSIWYNFPQLDALKRFLLFKIPRGLPREASLVVFFY